MQLYSDVVQDRFGNARAGKAITVKLDVAVPTLATLYSDQGVTLKDNPVTSDSRGYVTFYAANGTYTLWDDDSLIGRVSLFDGSIGVVRFDQAQSLTSGQQAQARSNMGFDAAVRAVALTGLSLVAATAITDADTFLTAAGKLQAQITANVGDLAASSGSSLVGYVQAGSNTVARTVQARLREAPVSSNDFSGADLGIRLNNAITYLKSVGGGIIDVPDYQVNWSTKVTVDASNILIRARGGDLSHDVGSQGAGAGTLVTWTGSAGGTIIEFISPTGASAQKQMGGGLQGFYFKASGAGIGLSVMSWYGGDFRNLFFEEFSTTGIDLGVVATLGEARDPQRNTFDRIGFRQFTQTGACITLDGDATANTSLNTFRHLDLAYKNGDGLVFRNSDNNTVYDSRANRASGGTGNPVVFHGSNTASNMVARANRFYHWSSGVAAVAKGTTSYTYASHDNNFFDNDADNGTPATTAETGANGRYSTSLFSWFQPAIASAGMGNSESSARDARDTLTTETVRIRNTSANHIRLYDNLSNEWGLNVDGSGNLRFNRVSGSGIVSVLQSISSTSVVTANSTTAIPAGGNSGNGFKFSSTANFGMFFGSGAPTFAAAQGSVYLRSDGTGPSWNSNGSTTWSSLSLASGKTLTASNTLTLAGTDGTTMTFPSTSAMIARTDGANTFTGTQTMPGLYVSNQGLGVNWAGATSNTQYTPFFSSGNHYGTTSTYGASGLAALDLNVIAIASDTVDYHGYNAVNGLGIYHNFGGGATYGSRQGLQIYLTQVGAMPGGTESGVDAMYGAAAFYGIGQYSSGGTAPSYTLGKGHMFGANPVARLMNGATNWVELVGMEVDTTARSGSSLGAKKGIQIVKESNDAVQGSHAIDTALMVTDQEGASVGWNYGITFGSASAQWPIDSAGTLLYATQGNVRSVPVYAGNGVDFSKVKFTTSAFKSMGFSVSGGGAVTMPSASIGPATFTANGGGLSIDIPNKIAASAAIAAGGSGYVVNDIVRTAYGGVYQVTGVSAGAVTSLTQLVPGVTTSSTPANPIATTADFTGLFSTGGTGLTLNVTWASATELRLVPTTGTLLIATDGGATNGFSIAASALGSGSQIYAAGGSSNIDFVVAPKNSGVFACDYPGKGTFFLAQKSGTGTIAALPYVQSGATGESVEFGAHSGSSDPNVNVNVKSKGTGTVQANGVDVVTTTGTQNLSAKTLTSPTINGGAATALTGLAVRNAGTGAFDMTIAHNGTLTAGRTLTMNLNDAARTVSIAGNVTTAADFITSGANSLTLTTTGSTNITLPTTGTLATRDGAEALSNKTITASSLTGTTVAMTGAITSSGATAGIGYATGAGGTVTQVTSKATGVTLNKVVGQITTANDALAAGATATFTLTNSAVAATDLTYPQLVSGNATAGTYELWTEGSGAGSVKVNIKNISAGSLSEALVIQFVVIKGVIA